MELTVRPARPDDGEFLAAMLLLAMNWDDTRNAVTIDDLRSTPALAHYVEAWPRPGDAGVVATENAQPVGAAWVRLFSGDDPGFGYVDAMTPELSIAVVPEARRRGVGTALMHALEKQAIEAGYRHISLSTERANRAHGWYRRLGYRVVHRHRHSDTMLKDLAGHS